MFKVIKVNNKNTRTTLLTSLWFFIIVNFEHIPHLFLVFLMLTLTISSEKTKLLTRPFQRKNIIFYIFKYIIYIYLNYIYLNI